MHGVTRRLAELFSPQYKIALPGIDHLNGGDTLKFTVIFAEWNMLNMSQMLGV